MKYVRVETYDYNTDVTRGGFMAATQTLLAMKLGVQPSYTEEELSDLINESDDPEVQELFSAMISLSSIPYPGVYIQDKENKVCLYQYSEFEECYEDLAEISMMLRDETDGKMCLIYKEFDLGEDELLYEDEYQVVISKETYDNHIEGIEYDVLIEW